MQRSTQSSAENKRSPNDLYAGLYRSMHLGRKNLVSSGAALGDEGSRSTYSIGYAILTCLRGSRPRQREDSDGGLTWQTAKKVEKEKQRKSTLVWRMGVEVNIITVNKGRSRATGAAQENLTDRKEID